MDSHSSLINADNLFAAIAHRRSMGLSKLTDAPVDREVIQKMLEAANWAPSHDETEPWRFTVFSGEGRTVLADLYGQAYKDSNPVDFKEELYEANRSRAFKAPVWISIGMVPAMNADGTQVMPEEDELMAVACAVQNLHLMASALGLAGMWHSRGLSVHPSVAKGLGIEAPGRLLGFFFCGWPSSDWATCGRRPIQDKVTWVETQAS